MTEARVISPNRTSIRSHLVATGAIMVVLVGGVGGWAATTEFSGAVIASGQLVVESNVKRVRHTTGGIVGEIYVRDGDKVVEGQRLLRLDDTQPKANYAIIVKALNESLARQARDEAERDGLDSITFPPELLATRDDPVLAGTLAGERRQFDIRLSGRNGQKKQLRERAAQLNDEIAGYAAQISSKANQIEWIGKELIGINDLWSKNLVPFTRITTLEREKERLEGERGQLTSTIAQARGKITEVELQILQVDQDMRAEVSKDLAELRGKISELTERKVASEDLLKHVDIRAPQGGVVHQLTVHAAGEIVAPQSDPILVIVPEADALPVEVRIQPQDIDQLYIGQPAALRFTAFNSRTTPEINGKVSRISADVEQDAKTGLKYYTVRIEVPEHETARLAGAKLVSGMPVETFIQTNRRTVYSFIVRPLEDQIMRAFREK
ncbi:MAG: HlyD family type secretion periplasmic adaptor subunit [Hyphomicrobiales bacterium]|nr:HlyD family type secretion periplasmic adaptor subunit [Hyphomicrobiales bacterium]